MSILELPDAVFRNLLDAATASGITPADWIATHLPLSEAGSDPAVHSEPSPEVIAEANARLRATRLCPEWNSNLDNESIDADLVREYGAIHSNLSQ